VNGKDQDDPQPDHQGEAPDAHEVVGQMSSVVQHLRQIVAAAFDADVAADLVEERVPYRAS